MKKALIRKVSNPIIGSIEPPTSKSLSNRALLIASLTEGRSSVTRLLESDDTKYMQACLKNIGVSFQSQNNTITVKGVGKVKPVSTDFFVGNAGTVARFFTAAASLSQIQINIDGDPAMRKRPIEPLLSALSQIGLQTESKSGYFPLKAGGQWTQTQTTTTIDADNSSQYISALMIIAPLLPEGLTIQTKSADVKDGFGYLDLTIQTMQHFGVTVETVIDGHKWKIANARYMPADYTVEADASAMTYIWGVEALTNGTIETGFDAAASAQPDARAHGIIKDYKNMPTSLDCSMMQDAVPTIAVLAALSGKTVRLTGLKNLRVKECDRIDAIHNELAKFGDGIVSVEVDDLCINGANNITSESHAVEIETYDDHRIAMAFALLGLVRDGVTILDPDCASKTYPKYWEHLSHLGVSIDIQG